MKKRTIFRIVVLTALAGLAVWVFLNIQQDDSPVVVQETVDMQEVQQQIAQNPDTVLKQGEFTDASLVYQGSGQAKVVLFDGSPVLKFENFKTTPGPDLFVYLSPNLPGEDLGDFVSLGTLKSDTGDQVYTLPDDYEKYKTVVVWCRAFAVTFTMAELK